MVTIAYKRWLFTRGSRINFGVMDRWLPLGGCHLQEVGYVYIEVQLYTVYFTLVLSTILFHGHAAWSLLPINWILGNTPYRSSVWDVKMLLSSGHQFSFLFIAGFSMKLSLFVVEVTVTLRNHDDNNNKKTQKARGLISKTKTKGAHFLVNFLAVITEITSLTLIRIAMWSLL